MEKAHIEPYCKTADNSYENLVILCPNCHTDFDKNSAFTPTEVLSWKRIRQQELECFFGKTFNSFEELKKEVFPLLNENKEIFENYYLGNQKKLWDKIEPKILANNHQLKLLLQKNRGLIQQYGDKDYSNLALVDEFILHIDEFETTRPDDEKVRKVLFPEGINSIFGVAPVNKGMIPSIESLECLIARLHDLNKYRGILLGYKEPIIFIQEGEKTEEISLFDSPRVRQLYYDYKCFRPTRVRLDSLNYALSYIRRKKLSFDLDESNLKEIVLNGTKMVFVYEYCLSREFLERTSPDEGTVIVNLHNWNGASCISQEAYKFASVLKIKLLTMDGFYDYINQISQQK